MTARKKVVEGEELTYEQVNARYSSAPISSAPRKDVDHLDGTYRGVEPELDAQPTDAEAVFAATTAA